jgi:hypothetical protein
MVIVNQVRLLTVLLTVECAFCVIMPNPCFVWFVSRIAVLSYN